MLTLLLCKLFLWFASCRETLPAFLADLACIFEPNSEKSMALYPQLSSFSLPEASKVLSLSAKLFCSHILIKLSSRFLLSLFLNVRERTCRGDFVFPDNILSHWGDIYHLPPGVAESCKAYSSKQDDSEQAWPQVAGRPVGENKYVKMIKVSRSISKVPKLCRERSWESFAEETT